MPEKTVSEPINYAPFTQYIPPAFVSELLELMIELIEKKLEDQPQEVRELFGAFVDLYYSHLLQARGASQAALEEFGMPNNMIEALQVIEKNGGEFWKTPAAPFWKTKPIAESERDLASQLFQAGTTGEE